MENGQQSCRGYRGISPNTMSSSDDDVEFIPPTPPEVIVISSTDESETSSGKIGTPNNPTGVYDKLRGRQKILEEVYNRRSTPHRFLWLEGLTRHTRKRVLLKILAYRKRYPAFYSVDIQDSVVIVECSNRLQAGDLRETLLGMSLRYFDKRRHRDREFYVDYAWDCCESEFDRQPELLASRDPPKAIGG